ncbi:centriolar satellite-associated tubulin polyglutamylase complex regulator 1-like isoform X2 [Tubulanus polymorphus]|uniref:centriolar satellite-associated tubulin polyglutamylase complex regulator 1-like isoform X2 n=1 Tax=Tubulanus polymorphus TaxID=672921 RepID=UPI003DA5F716
MAKLDRFSLQAEKYLSTNHVLVYLEDVVAQLLEYKDENPKVNTTKFFSDYFSSVRDGNHVVYREFSFIKSTPHNRASFIGLIWKCFRQIGKKGDLLTMKEYHSHICLLCQDFPFDLVQKTARIILIDDAIDCLISFSDFLYAFQVQFYYEEFLSKCADLYKALMSSTPRDTVIVPTQDQPIVRSEEKPPAAAAAIAGDLHDGVDSMQFYRALLPICDKHEFSCPPSAALKSILHTNHRVSFYGFLMALSKNKILSQSVGVLPPKEDIYAGMEDDNIPSKLTPRRRKKSKNDDYCYKI